MTESQADELLGEITKLIRSWTELGPSADPDEIEEVEYSNFLFPAPSFLHKGVRYKFTCGSGFSKDGSGPNPDRHDHWGADLMVDRRRDRVHLRNRLPYADSYGWWCPKGLPIINCAPGRVLMVDTTDMFGVTIEHRVKGVGQVLVHHKHCNRIHVDKGEVVAAGASLGIIGATGSDVNHEHFEIHEGRLGTGMEGAAR